MYASSLLSFIEDAVWVHTKWDSAGDMLSSINDGKEWIIAHLDLV